MREGKPTKPERKKKMEKKMTAKEMSKVAKKAVDEMLMELVNTYGVDALNSKTVETAMRDEILTAIYDLVNNGKILTAKERWGC